ncbi:MAG: transposase, partial [Nitrospira sp.]
AADHDANSLAPVLEDLKNNDLLPESMLADTAYGSDENVQAAADLGVELVTPMPGMEPASKLDDAPVINAPVIDEATATATPLEKLTIDDFAVNEFTGKVDACPSGRIPLNVLYNQGPNEDKTKIEMKPEDCETCPYREACPIEKTKKGKYTLDYTAKQRRQESRRREEDTDAFRERYAKRSGLESTNSGLKRKHGLGQLRVRGRPAVGHALYLKIAGWNMNRATASGKLASEVAAILRSLGFGSWLAACFSLFCAVMSVYRPWCRDLKANAA